MAVIFNDLLFHNKAGSSCGIMANKLDCNIVVSKFELQLFYYNQFWTNTLEKGINPFYFLPTRG